MSTSTSIEWTSATWNPIRARTKLAGKVGWHCEKVSAGCAHCYAETFNGRRLPGGGTGVDYTKRSRSEVETYIDEDVLAQPLRWRKPRKVFVCSMTDLFGEWVSDEQLDRVFAVMALCSHLTFQCLTKRPERMRAYVESLAALDGRARARRLAGPLAAGASDENTGPLPWPLPNLWPGVSVEDQATADERIPHLLATPAAVRFVSVEPLLDRVDLTWLRTHEGNTNALAGWRSDDFESCGVPRRTVNRIDWVIVGGESGPGARPCDVAWIRSLVEQARAAAVPVFAKQLGAHYVDAVNGIGGVAARPDPTLVPSIRRLRDRKGGDPSEWPEDLRVREFPKETPC